MATLKIQPFVYNVSIQRLYKANPTKSKDIHISGGSYREAFPCDLQVLCVFLFKGSVGIPKITLTHSVEKSVASLVVTHARQLLEHMN